MNEPHVIQTSSGWMALSRHERWAVRASTQQEAVERYRAAEERHREIDARPPRTEDGSEHEAIDEVREP